MKVLIQSPFDLNDLQRGKIKDSTSKLSSLDEKITQAEVYFKDGDGQGDNEVSATIRLHIPGNDVVASASHEDRMKAFHDAHAKAKRLLIKAKELKNRR